MSKIKKLKATNHSFLPSEPKWICHICGKDAEVHLNTIEATIKKVNEIIEELNKRKK